MSIPAGFRTELVSRSEVAPVLTHHGDHLALYPQEDWEEKERDLLSMSDLEPDVLDYQRYVVGEAVDCPVDAQGRILIPAKLRSHAELDKKVVVAGVLNRIEIWSPELFDFRERTTRNRLDEIRRSVDRSRRESQATLEGS